MPIPQGKVVEVVTQIRLKRLRQRYQELSGGPAPEDLTIAQLDKLIMDTLVEQPQRPSTPCLEIHSEDFDEDALLHSPPLPTDHAPAPAPVPAAAPTPAPVSTPAPPPRRVKISTTTPTVSAPVPVEINPRPKKVRFARATVIPDLSAEARKRQANQNKGTSQKRKPNKKENP